MSKTDVISRKDMKEPDKFQQAATQAAGWIAQKRRHVVIAGAAVVAVVVLIAILSAVNAGREERAGAAASDLIATLSGDPSALMRGQAFPDEEAREKAVVDAAQKVIAGNPGTGAARLALLTLGDAQLRLRALDDAKAAYERFLAEAPKDDSLRFGALEGIAVAEESKGNLDAAAGAWERLGREVAPFSDRADLERARVLARAGKTADAKALLASFGERHKDSALSAEASERLARLGGK